MIRQHFASELHAEFRFDQTLGLRNVHQVPLQIFVINILRELRMKGTLELTLAQIQGSLCVTHLAFWIELYETYVDLVNGMRPGCNVQTAIHRIVRPPCVIRFAEGGVHHRGYAKYRTQVVQPTFDPWYLCIYVHVCPEFKQTALKAFLNLRRYFSFSPWKWWIKLTRYATLCLVPTSRNSLLEAILYHRIAMVPTSDGDSSTSMVR